MAYEATTKPRLLHVGCGHAKPERLPSVFREWEEIRLDVDPSVEPDIVTSMTDIDAIADASVDAIWSSHNLEHLESHEVPLALREWRRVLRPAGIAFMTLPDLAQVAKLVADDEINKPIYESPAGPIAPLDIMFGHRRSVESGNRYMAHRTGFTTDHLGEALMEAKFVEADVWTTHLTLWAVAYVDQEAIDEYRDILTPKTGKA
jgi:predicted SAM-dependent methyltransferase